MKEPPSRLQRKVLSPSLDTNLKVALVLVVVRCGPEVIVVSGKVLSTMTVRLADVVRLPAASKTRAVAVAKPSRMLVESQLTL